MSPQSSAVLLFVYGSLRRCHRHAAWMQGATYRGPAMTTTAYTLCTQGPYPALRPGGTIAVAGELYEVAPHHLAQLDAFEGHPTLYTRQCITLSDGRTVQAYLAEGSPLAS